MGREAVSDKWVRLLPVTYALFSGMVGTQSVLFCKTLSTLLRTTIAGPTSLGSSPDLNILVVVQPLRKSVTKTLKSSKKRVIEH